MIPITPYSPSLSSYTVNVDSNPLLAKVFNTPSIINPLNGRIINTINDPYNPYLTVNSNITPMLTPTIYPPIIRNEIDDSGTRIYPQLSAIYPRPNFNPMVDVNNDPNLRNQMTAYFFEEFIYWLAKNERYYKLLSYLSVKGGNVVNEYDKDNKPEHKELKLKYFINTFNKYDISELLENFCRENRVNWWDLKKDGVKGPLKNYIYSKIKSFLKKKLARQ